MGVEQWLPLTPLAGLSFILVWCAQALVRGSWIPKSTHEAIIAQHRERADEWKETAMTERALREELVKQNGVLLEGVKTGTAFFKTVKDGHASQE